MTTPEHVVARRVKQPTDRRPKKAKTVKVTVHGVTVDVPTGVFDDPVLIDILTLEEDDIDEEDMRAVVQFTRSMVGKAGYRAMLANIKANGGGMAEAAGILAAVIEAAAPQLDALGNS